jgi:hypothetical protein
VALTRAREMGDDNIEDDPEGPHQEEFSASKLRHALFRLQLLGDDPFLRMQVFNLALVDQFVTELEREVLEKLIQEERTPIPEAVFLSAQSQMWIFAAFEIMRTWRERADKMIKWSENGILESRLETLEQEIGYVHFGRQFRAAQIRRVLADPSIIDLLKDDLKRIHIPYARMDAIRVSVAKHQVKGRKNSVALRPGYGRINQWSGSLDYELENGAYSMGFISRRDIADEIRALFDGSPPADKTITEFDEYMRGPGIESRNRVSRTGSAPDSKSETG